MWVRGLTIILLLAMSALLNVYIDFRFIIVEAVMGNV